MMDDNKDALACFAFVPKVVRRTGTGGAIYDHNAFSVFYPGKMEELGRRARAKLSAAGKHSGEVDEMAALCEAMREFLGSYSAHLYPAREAWKAHDDDALHEVIGDSGKVWNLRRLMQSAGNTL